MNVSANEVSAEATLWSRSRPKERSTPTRIEESCLAVMEREVRCLECDLDIKEATVLLNSANLTSAPVVDDNGILIGQVQLSALAQLRHERDLEVEDVMTTDVITVTPSAAVSAVAALMAQHQLDRIPVVTSDGHLLGVISSLGMVRWMATHL